MSGGGDGESYEGGRSAATVASVQRDAVSFTERPIRLVNCELMEPAGQVAASALVS